MGESDHWKTKREALVRDGVCVIKDILDAPLLDSVRRVAAEKIAQLSDKHRLAQKSPGSMLANRDMPELVDLITWPKTLQALSHLGFEDVQFSRAYLVSKPPHSPPLFWHQDCTMWSGEPRTYSEITPQLFAMFYLTDTTRENGCLRVIPGSHRRRHQLHDLIGTAHTAETRRMDDPGSLLYAEFEDQVDVLARAGDLVLGDGRALHASHANRSDHERTVMTVWYHPMFSELQESTQAQISNLAQAEFEFWPQAAKDAIGPLAANYRGSAIPLPRDRIPGIELH